MGPGSVAGPDRSQEEPIMSVRLAAVAVAALALQTSGATAETVAALVGNDGLVVIDTAEKRAGKPVKITGLSGPVVGLDVRPADGLLYALAADGTVATVDPKTGQATVKSKLETMLPAGVAGAVDFNPVADRMRVIGQDGTSLRANVDDGKVATDGKLRFSDTDAHKGKTPAVTAAAYTNSVKGTKETALYDIDATTGMLVKQAPPNDGILNSIGPVSGKVAAFDIVSDGQGANTAWVLVGGAIHKLDLATGALSGSVKIDGISGEVRDIAVLTRG
jgi:outer membrane protein assembly factor BamB